MSTLAELATHRETAGARYVAAIAEVREAYGDLMGIEMLLNLHRGTTPTFSGERPNPLQLQHPIYLPSVQNFDDEVRTQHAARSALFGTPDPEE